MNDKLKLVLDLSLGDGGIYVGSSLYPHFSFTHSLKQIAYAHHKEELLGNAGYKVRGKLHTWPDGKKGYNVSTASYPEFGFLRTLLYPNGKKELTERLFSFLDVRSLAYWFMDDGYATTRYKSTYKDNVKIYDYKSVNYYGFSHQSFSVAEQELFVYWLRNTFGIESKIKKETKGYVVVIYRGTDKDTLKNIIKPYIFDSMLYKLNYAHYLTGIPFTVLKR